MRRAVAQLQLMGWLVLLAGGLRVLAWTDSGPLQGPSLRHWSDTARWVEAHDTVTTGIVGVRLLAMAAVGYLLVVTAIGILGRLLHLRRLAQWADRGNVELARKVMAAALGAGLTITSLAAPASAAPRKSGGEPPPTMHRLGPATAVAPTTTSSTITSSTTTSSTSEVLDDAASDDAAPTDDAAPDATVPGPPADPAPTPAPTPTPAAPPSADPGPPTDPAPDAADTAPQPGAENLVTLAPGDNLWAIAERSLAGAWHRHPSVHETAPYWLQVIDANRSRLADPGDPDLVYPGQVIALPPPPAA